MHWLSKVKICHNLLVCFRLTSADGKDDGLPKELCIEGIGLFLGGGFTLFGIN